MPKLKYCKRTFLHGGSDDFENTWNTTTSWWVFLIFSAFLYTKSHNSFFLTHLYSMVRKMRHSLYISTVSRFFATCYVDELRKKNYVIWCKERQEISKTPIKKLSYFTLLFSHKWLTLFPKNSPCPKIFWINFQPKSFSPKHSKLRWKFSG